MKPSRLITLVIMVYSTLGLLSVTSSPAASDAVSTVDDLILIKIEMQSVPARFKHATTLSNNISIVSLDIGYGRTQFAKVGATVSGYEVAEYEPQAHLSRTNASGVVSVHVVSAVKHRRGPKSIQLAKGERNVIEQVVAHLHIIGEQDTIEVADGEIFMVGGRKFKMDKIEEGRGEVTISDVAAGRRRTMKPTNQPEADH